MDKFKFYIDRKLTTWEREFVSIEAETFEEAKTKIITTVEADDFFPDTYIETLYDCSVYLSPRDNDYCATVEIYENDYNELIWDNGNKY